MSYWIAGAAAVGALANRKKPLKGALMGAGLAMTGGAAAGVGPMAGLLGGAEAAGAGAAATGTAGAVIGGSGAPISAAAGAEMTASLNAAGYGGASAGASSWLPSMAKAGEYAKVGGNVLGAASAAKGLLSSPQQPVAQAQPRPLQLDAGLLSTNSQGIEDEAQRRRQLINQYAQNAMGGGYARPA